LNWKNRGYGQTSEIYISCLLSQKLIETLIILFDLSGDQILNRTSIIETFETILLFNAVICEAFGFLE
jgi:hypothetical protein